MWPETGVEWNVTAQLKGRPFSFKRSMYLHTPPHKVEVSFPSLRYTRVKESSVPYSLFIAGKTLVGFMPFPRLLVLCEIQTASFRIFFDNRIKKKLTLYGRFKSFWVYLSNITQVHVNPWNIQAVKLKNWMSVPRSKTKINKIPTKVWNSK